MNLPAYRLLPQIVAGAGLVVVLAISIAASMYALAWISGFTILVATIASTYAVRRDSDSTRELADRVQRLIDCSDEAPVDDSWSAEGALGRALVDVQRRIGEYRKREHANALKMTRMRKALVGVRVPIMVVDENGDVVFVNVLLQKLFEDLAGDIRGDIRDFDAATVVGSKATMFSDVFDLSGNKEIDITLGGHRFTLQIDPVRSDTGNRIGAVIAWEERTEEHAFENDLETMVRAAIQGDLSLRIDESRQTGFSHKLAELVNELVAIAENIIMDTLRVFGAMAHGSLDELIEAEYEGSFERLKQDANDTVTRLKDVVANIREASEAVNTAFREINHGNLNLSQRTEQQAASLQETASSMEQMTGTVQKNANNAREASELALRAREEAEKGGQVVGEAVVAMTEINESSKRIADIISVIDEIAFQTNLLALNASVEAARAGEQGRGFAVVAGEVRNLAGRSAEAAKEIKVLIGDSVAKVKNGSTLVDESGQTLQSIVARVKQVADIVAEISHASQEQATGIAQVNATISQMDDMTQQNAALVEQVSAAAELAGEQASRLAELVSFFGGRQTSVPSIAVPEKGYTPPRILPTATSPAVAAFADDDADADWEDF